MPEGSRVRIDLTGPVSRTYLVLVEGRAAVVDSFDRPPTVGIELPVIAVPAADRRARRRRPDPAEAIRIHRRPAAGRAAGGQPGLHHLSTI